MLLEYHVNQASALTFTSTKTQETQRESSEFVSFGKLYFIIFSPLHVISEKTAPFSVLHYNIQKKKVLFFLGIYRKSTPFWHFILTSNNWKPFPCWLKCEKITNLLKIVRVLPWFLLKYVKNQGSTLTFTGTKTQGTQHESSQIS